ncbi:hypothetical protein EX895_002086 [Sporisorium graminicola]|uniref:DUF3835 domain-containing protein n=1 Tax=Sporisorium graminicola TaxID=280036 RepID=A0A4U7KVV8_9BASI|nr:hypothetical protein EX895_002086 [Sporisorium graminicola]TKY88845.1 hypothetical protein EX895_002086 [Sporisorium graminicola]
MTSTLPSDPSDVSATAQALLQAHYGHMKQGANASNSDSLVSQQAELAKLEQAVRNVDRICLQLDNLQVAQQLHAGKSSSSQAARTLQPLGPLAFWPAQVVQNGGHVFVRQDPVGLSSHDQLLLEDEALPALTARPANGDKVSVSVRLPDPSRTMQVNYVKATLRDAQMQLQTRKSRYLSSAAELREGAAPELHKVSQTSTNPAVASRASKEHTVNENNEVLNEEGLPFYEPVEQITEEEAMQSKKAYMQPFVRVDDQQTADKEQRRRWLDNMLNKLEEEEKDENSDEEQQGAQEVSGAAPPVPTSTAVTAPLPAEEETRVVLRTRTPSPPPSPEDLAKNKTLPEIVSATRPPPPKSALKPTPARPDIVQRPSFGSAGIRRGFLNLNPSSPGAIKSSYSWEDLEKEEKKQQPASPTDSERPSRSHTPIPLSRNNTSSTLASSLLGRVADAGPSPLTSGTSTPTKKSVRIKSPERAHPEASAGSGLTPLQRALRSSIRVKENYTESATTSQSADDTSSMMARALESGSGTAEKRHRDDIGVEEEAERIVKLLGPDVVEGHPSAPPSDVLRKMQEAHEEDQRNSTPEAIAARAHQEEKAREQERLQRLAEKPALGHSVMERPKTSAPSPASLSTAPRERGQHVSTQVKAQQAKFSAFKAGFLDQKPTLTSTSKFVPNTGLPRKAGASANASAGVPAAPTQSMGMSALDRASLGDDELSERRQAMGLPAAVPHARPSKAYAEKMKQRQEGLESDIPKDNVDAEAMVGKQVQLARPVADDDVPRPGRVRFGPPAGSTDAATNVDGEDDDGHEQVAEINPGAALENHLSEDVDDGQELDEDQEEPKIEGEGADTDEEDAYFDSYLSKRSRRVAAAASRGMDVDDDNDDFDDDGDDDADDWGIDEDDFDEDEDDDDLDYDPEDLMALAPKMGADAESLAAHPELLKEYEEARAKLAAMGLAVPLGAHGEDIRAAMVAAARAAAGGVAGNVHEEEEEDDYEMDIVPLDAAVEDAEYQGNTTSIGAGGSGSRISRFKASLSQQRMSSTRGNAAKLEDMLSSAQNVGPTAAPNAPQTAASSMDGRSAEDNDDSKTPGAPVMIIPQLAPVRFPKNGDLIQGKASGPVDLDGGESDEDDEKAEMVMRSRLERTEWKKNHPEEARRLAETQRARGTVEQGVAPPSVARRQQSNAEAEVAAAEAKKTDEATEAATSKPKKVSRFKAARMAQ